MSADDSGREFVAAVVDSRYRRQRTPQPDTVPANVADELRRMLHEAMNPVDHEPTWRALFKRSGDLAAELFANDAQGQP